MLLDIHLAELYGVETRVLKQSVKRNLNRFPDDFMFPLSESEIDHLVSQNVIPSKRNLGGVKPLAFTETGIAMLSSVLKSDKAVELNIAIMRAFILLRKVAINYDEILLKLEELESNHEEKFKEIYKVLKHLLGPTNQKERNQIGFKQKGTE